MRSGGLSTRRGESRGEEWAGEGGRGAKAGERSTDRAPGISRSRDPRDEPPPLLPTSCRRQPPAEGQRGGDGGEGGGGDGGEGGGGGLGHDLVTAISVLSLTVTRDAASK